MAVLVRDLLALPSLKTARLVAGSAGVDRVVSRLSVADNPATEVDAQVASPGEFYLTELYLAHDHPSAMLAFFSELAASGAAGACVMDEYVRALPPQVVRHCDDLGLPVLFANRLVPYGQVIAEGTALVLDDQQDQLAESRIDALRSPALPEGLRAKTVRELCPDLPSTVCAVLALPRQPGPGHRPVRRFRWAGGTTVAFPYRNGMLVLAGGPPGPVAERLARELPGHVIGCSGTGHLVAETGQAIDEALTCARTARLTDRGRVDHDQLGMWEFVLLACDDRAARRYVQRILGPLREADGARADQGLERTVTVWLGTARDVRATAAALYVHENTVRYRLARAKALVEPFTVNADPFEEIALAVRLDLAHGLR